MTKKNPKSEKTKMPKNEFPSPSKSIKNTKTKNNFKSVFRFPDIFIQCVQHGKDGWTALTYAIFKGYIEIAKALLSREDIAVNVPNVYGGTALHCAIFRGHVGLAHKLLQVIATPKTETNPAFTILKCWILGFNSMISF